MSLRTYFTSRVAYKDYLRREKGGGPALANQRIIFGLPIVIEVERGNEQPAHVLESRKSPAVDDYGYISGTIDNDTEELDVFVGLDRDSPSVYVVDQLKDDGTFDEHKVLLCYSLASAEDAQRAYCSNYEADWHTRYGGCRAFSLPEFWRWLETFDPTQPVTSGFVDKIAEWFERDTKSELSKCVSRKIPILKREHPEWKTDQLVAVAYSYCRRKKKFLGEASGAAGGFLVPTEEPKCKKCKRPLKCRDCEKLEGPQGNKAAADGFPEAADWRTDTGDLVSGLPGTARGSAGVAAGTPAEGAETSAAAGGHADAGALDAPAV